MTIDIEVKCGNLDATLAVDTTGDNWPELVAGVLWIGDYGHEITPHRSFHGRRHSGHVLQEQYPEAFADATARAIEKDREDARYDAAEAGR